MPELADQQFSCASADLHLINPPAALLGITSSIFRVKDWSQTDVGLAQSPALVRWQPEKGIESSYLSNAALLTCLPCLLREDKNRDPPGPDSLTYTERSSWWMVVW